MKLDPLAASFLTATASYIAVSFLCAALVCVWSLWRRWYDIGMRPQTREALLGISVVLFGVSVHFAAAFIVRRLDIVDWNDAGIVYALFLRTVLMFCGLMMVVRAWTRPYCGERGWLTVMAISLLVGVGLDFAMVVFD